MTKRTLEKTLTDELAQTGAELDRRLSDFQRAAMRVEEATGRLEIARELVRQAELKLGRIENALNALTPATEAIDPALSDALDTGVEYEREPDRETLIAAAVGTDVESVRQASGKRAKSSE